MKSQRRVKRPGRLYLIRNSTAKVAKKVLKTNELNDERDIRNNLEKELKVFQKEHDEKRKRIKRKQENWMQ